MEIMVNVTKPTLYLEKNLAGNFAVRVEEQKLPNFSADIEKHDLNFAPKQGGHALRIGDTVSGAGKSVDISNFDVSERYLGISLKNTTKASIYDLKFEGFDDGKFGAAVRVGYHAEQNRTFNTTGITYVQRVEFDGQEAPLKSYADSNKDFLASERDNKPIYVRDITALNASDAIFDAKSTVYIMNATLSGAHRVLRVWSGVEIVLVNCVIENEPGKALAWLQDDTSSIKFYNTTWNGLDAPTEAMISGEKLSKANTLKLIKKLDSNPLEAVDDFFKSDVKEIHVEVSTNGGGWRELELSNNGQGRAAPIGDTLYTLPNLGGGVHEIRSWYLLENGQKSEYSEISTMVGEGPVLPVSEQPGIPIFNEQFGTDAGDVLFAKSGGSALYGKGGMDTFYAGSGADIFDGGAKNDTVTYINAKSSITVDMVDSANGKGDARGDIFKSIEIVKATQFDDAIYGNNGAQKLYGLSGNDVIFGRGGNDVIYGGLGNDILAGGLGRDHLRGEGGQDTFLFTAEDFGGVDTIMDFNAKQDKIDLSSLLDQYDPLTESIHDFLKISAKGNDALISIDVEGKGKFVDLVLLTGQAQTVNSVDDIALA
jgi:hypothetical protein